MANVVKLVGEQVDEISLLSSGLPYKTGKRSENKETYSRLRYNGIVFNVPDNSPFIKDFEAGKVATVKLLDTERESITTDDQGVETTVMVKGYEFDSFISMDQQLNRALHTNKLAMLSATASSKDLTPESINALMAL